MITCFHNYNILAKTYGRMTTALCFPASMTMVNACTQLRPEKSCRHYSRPCLLCCMLFNKFNFVLDIIVIKVPYIAGLISVLSYYGWLCQQPRWSEATLVFWFSHPNTIKGQDCYHKKNVSSSNIDVTIIICWWQGLFNQEHVLSLCVKM